MDIDKEFSLLSEYMDIFVQLIAVTDRRQIPSFSHFKENYDKPNYSLSIPHYKDTRYGCNRKIMENYAVGLGVGNGVAYRYFNYYKGNKFFTSGNIFGEFTITDKIHKLLE